MRKVLTMIGHASNEFGLTDFRQYKYNIGLLKKLCRIAQKTKKANYKDEAKKRRKEEKVKQAHSDYIVKAQEQLDKAKAIREKLEANSNISILLLVGMDTFVEHAERQIDQISRRVLNGEVIPHEEKVFSIFEPHTEWVTKGKVKTPVELGLKVCVMEDQFGFILGHRVMEKESDADIPGVMVKETKEKYDYFASCSFDKGFYSKGNKARLSEEIEVIMPKKGKLNKQEREEESASTFIGKRYQHSAVESCINALEQHGLDRCLDHGIEGFKRYVSLAVLARNIQQIGAMLRDKSRHKKLKKKAA